MTELSKDRFDYVFRSVAGLLKEMCRNEHLVSYFDELCIVSQSTTHFILVWTDGTSLFRYDGEISTRKKLGKENYI